MNLKIRKNILKKSSSFGLGFLLVLGSALLVYAVTPGSITNPSFSPSQDDVRLGESFSVTGDTINGVTPGRKYAVNVYGVIREGGDGMVAFPVTIRDCATGNRLASSASLTIANAVDGNNGQSFTLITTPTSNCIKGYTDDNGDASASGSVARVAYSMSAVPVM